MPVSRSARFNPNVDPELLASLEKAGEGYSPYRVELTSGYRPKSRGKYHPLGEAIDIALHDPKTGAMLDSYQGGGAASAYQQFANAWYKSLNPEQQKKARWGGYFGDPTQPGYGSRYGEQDYMHFDFGRTPELGMAAGDWGTGYRPEAMKALGLSSAGGVDEGTVQQVAAATGASTDQVRAAFLSAISGTEAPAYNTLYGGGTFGEDYSQHPNRKIPIMSGPNKGDYSTAAGRYQFLKSTWDQEQAKLGLKDFSAASQDAAAWDLAATAYKQATGSDLQEALASNDPARINAAAQILNKTWTSLPGGSEQAKAYGGGGKTFYDVYSGGLGTAGDNSGLGKAAVTGAGAGAGGAGATGAVEAQPQSWGDQISKALSKGLGGNFMAGAGTTAPNAYGSNPKAANFVAQQQPLFDPAAMDKRRQLAMLAMQRLNQGTLV